MGMHTYCLVSGVVFEVKEGGAARDLAEGIPLFFCCETCAEWFDTHRERVIEVRKLVA